MLPRTKRPLKGWEARSDMVAVFAVQRPTSSQRAGGSCGGPRGVGVVEGTSIFINVPREKVWWLN